MALEPFGGPVNDEDGGEDNDKLYSGRAKYGPRGHAPMYGPKRIGGLSRSRSFSGIQGFSSDRSYMKPTKKIVAAPFGAVAGSPKRGAGNLEIRLRVQTPALSMSKPKAIAGTKKWLSVKN